jgi:hypothetical protein
VIVQSQSAKKAILAALADEEMTKILDSVMYHSKSIVDITRENDIPHTTCYRKTKWLLNEGLVIVLLKTLFIIIVVANALLGGGIIKVTQRNNYLDQFYDLVQN